MCVCVSGELKLLKPPLRSIERDPIIFLDQAQDQHSSTNGKELDVLHFHRIMWLIHFHVGSIILFGTFPTRLPDGSSMVAIFGASGEPGQGRAMC